MEQNKVFMAIDVLHKTLEFISLCKDSKEWKLEALKNNPPRYYLLLQIEALLNAFFDDKNRVEYIDYEYHLGKLSIQNFIAGDFIKSYKIEAYNSMFDFIYDETPIPLYNSNHSLKITKRMLLDLFQRFLEFKKRIRNLEKFNGDYLMANSYNARFSIKITDDISANLTDKQDKINQALELIINPLGLSFDYATLVSKYNYPDIDLEELNLDYL